MMRFAPAWTVFWSTSSAAIEVVTAPVTIVAGSPALNVSTSSLLQSTPMFFFTRSTMSCAVTVAALRSDAWSSTNGVAIAPAAVSATKSRLEISVTLFSRGLGNHARRDEIFYAYSRVFDRQNLVQKMD